MFHAWIMKTPFRSKAHCGTPEEKVDRGSTTLFDRQRREPTRGDYLYRHRGHTGRTRVRASVDVVMLGVVGIQWGAR